MVSIKFINNPNQIYYKMLFKNITGKAHKVKIVKSDGTSSWKSVGIDEIVDIPQQHGENLGFEKCDETTSKTYIKVDAVESEPTKVSISTKSKKSKKKKK